MPTLSFISLNSIHFILTKLCFLSLNTISTLLYELAVVVGFFVSICFIWATNPEDKMHFIFDF